MRNCYVFQGMAEQLPGGPAGVVRVALQALRGGDAAKVVTLCTTDRCLLGVDGQFDVVSRLIGAGRDGPSAVTCGEPEHIGDGCVLVLLAVRMVVGERVITARATAVWTVTGGLISDFRYVPGDRKATLLELGRAPGEPDEAVTADAVRTAWREARWVSLAGPEVLASHTGKHAAIAAGRRLARAHGVPHVIERQDGTIAMVEHRSRSG